MAIIKISVPNPNDGTSTFDKVRFFEATDSSGTGAAQVGSDKAIDTSSRSQLNPGVTSLSYTSGATTKYYAAKYYNSVTTDLSDYTTWVLGGKDRWDTMFENEMKDTTNTVWTAEDVARFKQWALDELYPELYQQVIDTTLSLDNDGSPSHTYEIPFGIFNISEVGVGDINNSTSTFRILANDSWALENSLLHLYQIPSTESGAVIRLIAAKKFMEVGDVPERFDSMVMDHLKMSAYLNMSEDFPRYKKWAQMQEGTKVSFENMRVQAREYERKFRQRKAEMQEALYPSLT